MCVQQSHSIGSSGGCTAHRYRRCAEARRAGTAATEFALSIPILLLLALACSDFGRISHYDEVVSNAARTGAETGATRQFTDYTHADWDAGVRQAVVEEMQNIPDFNESELNCNVSTTTDSDGVVHVLVDVTYPFRTVVTWPALPSQITLHQYVEFRQFR